jgi:hypothetical protein
MQTEVISFYSDVDGSTYYSDHAVRLKEQLTSFNIPHDIRQKDSLGSYQLNCLSKPEFIYKLLIEKQKPVVWLDIDSDVKKSLNIYDQFDNTDLVFACSTNRLIAAKASPIYFNFNQKVLEFLQHWKAIAKEAAEKKEWFDHESLIGLLQYFYSKPEYSIKFLGPDYCTWPGSENDKTVIIMGLADVESKKQSLRDLGMAQNTIEWQCVGNRK